MKCYHCEYENNDDAIYCKNCGLRVDGKVECPNCNKLIDFDSQFCGYCGHNLQTDKNNCVNTHNEEVEQQSQEQVNLNTEDNLQSKPCIKKIFDTGIGLFSMMAVFFSLLFTFFIGISYKYIALPTGDSSIPNSEINLFYYLGECYENAPKTNNNYPQFCISNFYFTTILGTLLSIAIIITVITFAIIAIVRYINYTTGKSKKSYMNFALSTYISFILGVTIFYAFNGINYKSAYSTSNLDLTINNHTIAGVVLATLFIILANLCKTAQLGKTLTTPQNVHKLCLSALKIVMLAFVATLVASPLITVTLKNNTFSLNFLQSMNMLSIIYLDMKSNSTIINSSVGGIAPPTDIYANLVIGLIIQIAMIVLVILMAINVLKNLSNNNKQTNYKGLGVSIANTILSIILLIVTLNAENQFVKYIYADAVDIDYSFKVYPLILMVIVSVVYLAIEIIHTIININTRQKLNTIEF